ncbi:hypothetical protein ASPWEDRAFT_244970 [Aspergillus wentii DTO 134E9]|uniref:Pre-mRNA-splicing factor n=1 Tax=Aspergillus wentii DTO 134E9 TaxID=1073089 RepID=A0A1L9S1P6_ASPWE|nr:uncharacterized protein ASPWEDRAFT_244970 [Aspergillus wentii DTO 134E9]OJJ41098.1 hypothetical protein ASPWEDRAFT_244970 [Aspergillus wentii DTO 134E9]
MSSSRENKKPFSLSLGSNGPPKKASFNLQSSGRANESSNRTLPRRPHQLHDDDSEEEEGAPVHEAVTGFDTNTGSVITADGQSSNEKQPLVIQVASGNNWRDRAGTNHRRPKGKNLLPKEVQALQEAQKRGVDIGDNVDKEGPSMSYGLSFAKPSTDEAKEDRDQPMQDAEPATPPPKPLTDDEIALQALIRDTKGETEGRTDLVIESSKHDQDEEDGTGGRYDETSSFRTDVASRPEPASLDQYNAIPVEEFGAALLRGMGWKDGQSIGRGNYGSSADAEKAKKPRIPERRPGYLGIGAKDVSGGKGAEAEIGAWGKAAMRKGARKAGEGEEGKGGTEGVYMPVMMRNKNTGEYVTEDELAALQKEAKSKKDDDEWRDRRDRNLEKSGRDRDRDRDSRRRDYDRGDDSDRYDRRKSGSSRRDRSSSGDRHSRRKRYDDEDGKDDRYYRDRDHDRERRRDRDRSRDRSHRYRDDDRYSSSRHSSSRRDRDRDRDRDSDRDSHRRRRRDDR